MLPPRSTKPGSLLSGPKILSSQANAPRYRALLPIIYNTSSARVGGACSLLPSLG